MISSAVVVPIVRFHGNINASVYIEILHQHGLFHLRKGAVETRMITQDNAPCHKAKTDSSSVEEELQLWRSYHKAMILIL